MKGQINYFDEISVDLFAGGGGASTGYELATGQPVTIAINHSRDAVLMHKTNHPWTEHYQADVFEVDPQTAVRGRNVGFLWASPDCRHFSKAKGAPLVDRKIRGLAWVILRWAMDVRPRVIMAENVEEIQTWGPLIWDEKRSGWVPDPARKGETFNAFIGMLTDGAAFYIRDILLRMLSPRELYLAMGFPPDYIIDRDYMGNAYAKNKQVARCGNAVCPPMAEAVIRANYKAARVSISSMAQLADMVEV